MNYLRKAGTGSVRFSLCSIWKTLKEIALAYPDLVSLDSKTIPHPPPLFPGSLTMCSDADKEAPKMREAYSWAGGAFLKNNFALEIRPTR